MHHDPTIPDSLLCMVKTKVNNGGNMASHSPGFKTGVDILLAELISLAALSKLLDLSEPQFPYVLKQNANIHICPLHVHLQHRKTQWLACWSQETKDTWSRAAPANLQSYQTKLSPEHPNSIQHEHICIIINNGCLKPLSFEVDSLRLQYLTDISSHVLCLKF